MTTNQTPTPAERRTIIESSVRERMDSCPCLNCRTVLPGLRNAHDELVAALREAVQMIDSHSRGITKNNPVAATMRAVLAKVMP